MEDKIKQLEERINKLESNITKLFGKSFRTVGNTESDLLLKTRGNIKVQCRQSFADIFKDGKLNVNIDIIRERIRKKVEESKEKIEKRKEEIGKIIKENRQKM